MIKPEAELLFEASWEVCNKIGGIYTVVKSKAALTKKHYKNYFLVGPYFEKNLVEFEQKEAPEYLSKSFSALEKEGIICKFGAWNIRGEPDMILVDSSRVVSKKNEIKTALWNDYKIDSLYSQWEFEEPIVWSYAVARLIEEVSSRLKGKKIVAHFHEWLAGTALLHLKKNKVNIGCVFTTHATMLGRTIAGFGEDLYGMLPKLNPDAEAYKRGIQDKFTTERACAQNADVFTTVSEITAIEAEKILGRKPEVLLLNGLDIEKFPTVEEFSIKHVTCREKIREFLISYFYPYYTFEVNNVTLMFIVGRYEFKNKGIDLFIHSLGQLNDRLKEEKSKKTVAVFFWIPRENNGPKIEVLENKNYYRHIKNYVAFNSEKILSNIVYDIVSQKDISKGHLFTKDFIQDIKKDILSFKRKGNPPIITHNINDEQNDIILKELINYGLDNREDDPVKVIYYPTYLDVNDGLVNLSYYDAMAGCHLGVFPSYYEPWGYTPLEASALGVPSVTSDLAGFGRFIEGKLKNNLNDGIFVLKRFNRKQEDIERDFTELLYKFIMRDKHSRAANKLNAKELSGLADWKLLIENYIKAHNLAVRKII
ncbi:MAG TPA: glycosyltransferase [Candidatus Nanoarchaeia archaeon]|nr:glycosyltransferase [Candidatus Nanoarchaeia archaeon]